MMFGVCGHLLNLRFVSSLLHFKRTFLIHDYSFSCIYILANFSLAGYKLMICQPFPSNFRFDDGGGGSAG